MMRQVPSVSLHQRGNGMTSRKERALFGWARRRRTSRSSASTTTDRLRPERLSVVASIDLAVEGRGEIARAWSDPKGSRGEGIVLLPGGHLLVAKEKKPAAFSSQVRCFPSTTPKSRLSALTAPGAP